LCSASAPSFQLTALLLLHKQLGRTCVDIQRTCNRFWLCVATRGTCTNRQTPPHINSQFIVQWSCGAVMPHLDSFMWYQSSKSELHITVITRGCTAEENSTKSVSWVQPQLYS
jgi:hypothetical protein